MMRRIPARRHSSESSASHSGRATLTPPSPWTVSTMTAAGWSKRDVRALIHVRARVTRAEWHGVGKAAVVGDKGEDVHPALRSPDDLLVVAAGGPAGGFGAVVPPWYGARSLAVTVPVESEGGSG